MYCFMVSIFGILAIDLMDKMFLGDIWFSWDVEMMLIYVYYVVNGMGCEDLDYGFFDMGFWFCYVEYMLMFFVLDEFFFE